MIILFRRKIEVSTNLYSSALNSGGPPKAPSSVKKKKAVTLKPAKPLNQPQVSLYDGVYCTMKNSFIYKYDHCFSVCVCVCARARA